MHYIPISRSRVRRRVLEDLDFEPSTLTELHDVADLLEALWHHRNHAQFEALKQAYDGMDPDGSRGTGTGDIDGFMAVFENLLKDGNWDAISDEELKAALEGEDVFPISLNVRFDELLTNRLYKLGEAEVQTQRSSFFGLKKQTLTVEMYDRVIQVLQFQDRAWFENNDRLKDYPGTAAEGVHLRLFKSVPKLDLETIYPNTSPNMRTLDKIKIAAPLVGGLVALGIKFGPLLFGQSPGETSLAVILGIVSALKTYMVKSYMSYRTTREKYLAHVSKDLYFKGQANNAAVLNVVTDLSEEQEVKEALLAYCFLHADTEIQHTQESLDARVEAWLTDTFNIHVDFEVDDALEKLDALELLTQSPSGELSVTPPHQARQKLQEHWVKLYARPAKP